MTSPAQIATFTEPSFGENAYVVWTREGGPCWVVDPGPPPSAMQILRHIQKLRLQPEAIVLTHGHADHIAGIPEILSSLGPLPVYISNAEKSALSDAHENLSDALGMPFTTGVTQSLDLPNGGTITLDGLEWRILDTSGHSPGGRSLYQPESGLVIVGDALFHSSIGRTDFHHSDHRRLIRNIKERLFALPGETQVYSGHGPVTTIGREKQYNPFLQ